MRRPSPVPQSSRTPTLSSAPRLSRRAAAGRLTLGLLALGSSALAVPSVHAAPPEAAAQLLDAATRGRQFLASLFDPQLQLLPEFRGSDVYWLYHDNYLAAKVLQTSHADLAEQIRASLARWEVRHSGKIEILFHEAQQPWPLKHHRLDEVARVGARIIKTERTRPDPIRDFANYTDLLCFAALARATDAPAEAQQHLAAALATWDGLGLTDRVHHKSRIYATYKLALLVLAASALDQPLPCREPLTARLLTMQRADGGWITDYDAQGQPVGEANVETTSLVILALERLSQH